MLLKQMHLEPAKYTGGGSGAGGFTAALLLAAPGSSSANNNNQRSQFTAANAGRQSEPISSATAAAAATTTAAAATTFANAHYSNANGADGSHYTLSAWAAAFCFGDLSGAKRFPALPSGGGGAAVSAELAGAATSAGGNALARRDRLKLMELSIINLVERSAQANAERRVELALELAKEAADGLGALKAALAQEQREPDGSLARPAAATTTTHASSDKQASKPMTTGASLFELALMVNSNLAGRLRRAGQLEEAVELYTQLCKQASGTASGQLLASSSFFLLGNLGGPGSSASAAAQMSTSGGQQELRFLLYRFGINIGNALFEAADFQRALKYYRLTLDRLSSSASLRNLRAKLMNNISLALLAQQEQQSRQRQQRQQEPVVGGLLGSQPQQQPADAITSLNLLLADNLSPWSASKSAADQGAGGSTAQAAAAAAATAANSNAASSTAAAAAATASFDVCNSNHHRFGLNLIVCHHQRADLTSMMSALKALVRVDICHQYRRVFDWPLAATKGEGGGQLDLLAPTMAGGSDGRRPADALEAPPPLPRQRAAAAANSATSGQLEGGPADAAHALLGAERQKSGRTRPVRGDARTTLIGAEGSPLPAEATLGADEAAADERELYGGGGGGKGWPTSNELGGADFGGRDCSTPDHDPSGALTSNSGLADEWLATPLSSAEKCRQVMSCIQEDRLEILIGEKHGQIARALIMASKLLLDLDGHARSFAAQQQRQHRPAGSSLAAANFKAAATSALDFCLKLMASSDSYKALICDLKTNNVSSMLESASQLEAAIALLKGIDSEQQQQQQQLAVDERKGSSSGALVRRARVGRRQQPTTSSKAHLLLGKASVAVAAATNPGASAAGLAAAAAAAATTTALARRSNTLASSSMVATNASLLRLLQRRTKQALSLAEQSIRADKVGSVESWINLANCHLQLGNFKQAEQAYQRALALDPARWETNYNLALLNRKLGRQFNELRPTIRSSLARDRKCLMTSTRITRKELLLSLVQLALIYQQSVGKQQQTMVILNELIANTRSSPEIYLMASKLMDSLGDSQASQLSSSSSSSSSSAAAAAHQRQAQTINSNNVLPSVALLQQANREHSYYLPVLERLIALNIRNFNYQAAQALLLDCIKLRPDQVKWFRMLAECHRRAANYNGAIAIYKQAIDLFPQDTSCLKALIKLADELGLKSEKEAYEAKLDKLTNLGQLQNNLQDGDFMASHLVTNNNINMDS